MIDERFIESARQIRKRYMDLQDQLDDSKKNISLMVDFVKTKLSEIEVIEKEQFKVAKNNKDLEKVSIDLLSKIQDLEERENSLTKRVDDINKKIENLKKEEIDLMSKIIDSYPSMTRQEIIKEVHSRLWA